MDIGKRIKQRREELGMTQEELALLCEYTSRSAVYNIEKGCNKLRQDKVKLFSKALGVSPGYLLGWTDIELGAERDAQHMKKYQALSAEDRKTIDDMLDFLYQKTQEHT